MGGAAQALRIFVAQYGLVALFILLTLEEAGIWLPLPGDLFILYFGSRVAHANNPLRAALPVLIVITVAVLCGSLLLYLLTRRLRGAVRRLGRLIHLNERRLAQMEGWLGRHGPLMVIPGRLIPGLRIPTTVVAGLFDVPLSRFVPAVAVAAVLWGTFYLVLGAAGHTLLTAIAPLRPDEPLDWLFSIGVVLALAGGAVTFILRRRQPPAPSGS